MAAAVLVGFCGPKGAGKDTAYSFVQKWARERGVRAGRGGFADALKLSFARLFIPDCSTEEAVLWADELKVTGKLSMEWERSADQTRTVVRHEVSGRVAYQRFGTEGHRDIFGDDFWVDVLLPEQGWSQNFVGPMDFGGPPEFCCITDTRFENEAKRIHERGGVIWKIDRAGLQGEDVHRSETGLPLNMVDRLFLNHGSLDDLEEKIREALEEDFGNKFIWNVENVAETGDTPLIERDST